MVKCKAIQSIYYSFKLDIVAIQTFKDQRFA
jgi:hypothetical protein